MLKITHVAYNEAGGPPTVRGSIPARWAGYTMNLESTLLPAEILATAVSADTDTVSGGTPGGHFYFDLNDFQPRYYEPHTRFELRLADASFAAEVHLFESPGVWLTVEEV